jgi:hypothetical protein
MLNDKVTIYKFPLSGENDFDTGDDTFEFVGAFRFAGSCYIFVPKAKESKVKTQPTKAKLTKVTNLKEIASFCCNSGIDVHPLGLSDEKLASFKLWGYDLLDEYTDKAGIEKASNEWLNAL